MNAERLVKHFDRIADAPEAIPRLRRFILDLAVRGKLVEQNPNDEPASDLLRRIEAKKGSPTTLRAVTPNQEVASALPKNWVAVPLIALGEWAIGTGFPKNEQGSEDGPYFFLKVSDMNLPGNEKYVQFSQNTIDDTAAARIRARIHPAGTIIFPKIGAAIATNKRRILTRGSAIDNNCLGITFGCELTVDWCYLLLSTMDFARYQAGTAVPALQQGVLARIPIGLPPLAEQLRIVAKVDELMGLCDRLEAAQAGREHQRDWLVAASLHALNQPAASTESDRRGSARRHARFYFNHLPRMTTRIGHIKKLRQTILNLAIRGKLVPQDPNDKPASELVERIRAQKAQLVKNGKPKSKPSIIALAPEVMPHVTPPTWTCGPLGQNHDFAGW